MTAPQPNANGHPPRSQVGEGGSAGPCLQKQPKGREHKMKRTVQLLLCFLCICGLAACNHTGQPSKIAETRTAPHGQGLQPDTYGVWPTEDFTLATPESQGVDSNVILDRLNQVVDREVQPDSYLILRNGYLISETYFHGYDKDTAHTLYSITKSVLSALVGIAIGEGYITGADQKVRDFFPEVSLAEDSQHKKEMTVEHLLTMTSGIRGDKAWDELTASENVGGEIFALAQKELPGEKFLYDSTATHLLGILVSRATGKPLFDYAKEKLFDPLGISSVFWGLDAQGNYNGGNDISMTPRDMLRFGYLYLNYGRWGDKQIIPADWVAQTPPQLQQSGAYGRLFWANEENPEDGYEAAGFEGQYIAIFPELDMVVVVTNSANENRKYLFDEIRKGVQDDPLPENPQTQKKLAQLASRVSPQPPDYMDLQTRFAVAQTHPIDLSTLRASEGSDTDPAYEKTEAGWCLRGESLFSRMETQEAYQYPLLISVTYVPHEDSNLLIKFRDGEMGVDHNQQQPAIWVMDFMTASYASHLRKPTPVGRRPVTVQWILHESFQAFTVNGQVLLYNTDCQYMHKASFRKRKKAPVQLSAAFSGVTVQSMTVQELQYAR